MRLLHVTRLEFEEFFDDKIPTYAILSHRWGADEVSYQDFLAGRKREGAGYAKILACCKYAAQDLALVDVTIPKTGRRAFCSKGYYDDWVRVERCEWVWIDTCNIDKTSSAELAESINSMYEWYKEAHTCYAYLSDVIKHDDDGATAKSIGYSTWFERGWTLQELLAPKELVFLDQNWTNTGTRTSRKAIIAHCTGIAKHHFDAPGVSMGKVCIAEKLSWAADRKTSRREDQAYCLSGLFLVNIPLLYGEGDRAFNRLQAEIIRSSNDESILLWDVHWYEKAPGKVLATSPSDFWGLSLGGDRKSERNVSIKTGVSRPPFAITNQGLEFRVPRKLAQKSRFLLPL